jgi:hypothetical protein
MSEKEFEDYLESIGGLVNGHFVNRPPIIKNICECNDGWLEMIKNCIDELIAAGWNKEICQIKEKFGGLRFYTNVMTKECYDIVSKYEKLSYTICEVCGAPGKVRNQRWIRTLCDNHNKEKND